MTPEEQERANEIFDHLQRIDAEKLKQSAQNAAQNGGDNGMATLLVGAVVVGGHILNALFGGGE